ncbi:hypothetical protein [Desulfosporosinus meridiei]|uniref:Uncharacterized protein n=1 Tax=Desulfosporosinus meridiei (strain ATCC BAA-275 / DSM 13257 / KCTC 12902 / NCIMB 13706 / S10) TaxID=768704 RepID=J7IPA1_DESMD|nr:hypothetical protein [Desulfosporosinus meridiei]AFQ43430.1 hypothetical protein Desmer_1437 [Desulfosporosinus meridiei DSM 13257]
MLLLLISAFLGVVLYEVPNLIRNKYWRELVVFSVLFSLTFMLALLQTLGFQIPSPAIGVDYLVEDILHINYR